jgi:hypothetical protein
LQHDAKIKTLNESLKEMETKKRALEQQVDSQGTGAGGDAGKQMSVLRDEINEKQKQIAQLKVDNTFNRFVLTLNILVITSRNGIGKGAIAKELRNTQNRRC